jgi:hypothetical protein
MAPIRRELESGGIDNTIEFILLAIRYDTFLGDRINSPALSVYQLDRWFVECIEILIMKAGALAKLVIVRLEAFGRLLVFDDVVDAFANRLHLFEVGDLPSLGEFFRTCCIALFRPDKEFSKYVCPAIGDEVNILVTSTICEQLVRVRKEVSTTDPDR